MMKKEEVFYRGEPEKYNKPCTCSMARIINKKKSDEGYEKQFYRNVMEKLRYQCVLKDESVKEEFVKINTLSYLQHYGFSTRLLDVTRDVNVARYFACRDEFKKPGFIYEVREDFYKTLDIKIVREKLKMIFESNTGNNNKNLDSQSLVNLQTNVTLDYTKVFKSKISEVNVRYKKQESLFVFCGNKIYKNKILNNKFTEVKYSIKEEIKGENKLRNLLELTRKHKINHVNLFPDESESLKITNLYFELTTLSSEDLISISEKKIIQQLFNKSNKKNINVELIKNILSNFELFAFFCYEIKYFFLNFTKMKSSYDALRTNTTLESLIEELILYMKNKKIRRIKSYEACI